MRFVALQKRLLRVRVPNECSGVVQRSASPSRDFGQVVPKALHMTSSLIVEFLRHHG